MFDFEKDFDLGVIETPKPKQVEKTKPIIKKAEPFELVKTEELKTAEPKTAEQIDWFDQHYYKVGEDFYPSVTTILQAAPFKQQALAYWRGDIGNNEADKQFYQAGERGTFIHNCMTKMLNGNRIYFKFVPEGENGLLVTDQWDAIQLHRIAQFFKVVKPVILHNELIVYSHKHRFAGSIDLVLEIKDGSYLIDGKKPVYLPSGVYIADLKTSRDIHDDYWLQVAAYTFAFQEMYPDIKITNNLILHTKSSNKLGIEGFSCKTVKLYGSEEEIEDNPQAIINENFNAFLDIHKLWKRKPVPTKPKLFNMPNKISIY